jgi:geranylgeranyl diphosphate synthase type I
VSAPSSSSNRTPAACFEAHLAATRAAVDLGLLRAWAPRERRAKRLGGAVAAVTASAQALVMRGGKRLRAALLSAAYDATGGEGGPTTVVMAGVALELLQGFLLIHDDWMDDDDVRRGGPAVHAAMAEALGGAQAGAAAAVLVGDQIAGMAQVALLEVPLPSARLRAAAALLGQMQEEVAVGQMLDLFADKADADAISQMHDLKTGSYTARGPIAMGAALSGATSAQRAALARYAKPLGLAFQLRDDLLGLFGDPAKTGKPVGGDLRRGKRSAPVAELSSDPAARDLLARVWGVADARDEDLRAVLDAMVQTGVRARIEERIAMLAASADAALDSATLEPSGRDILRGAIGALSERDA